MGNNGNPKPNLYTYGATFQCGTIWSQVVDLNSLSGYLNRGTVYIAAAALVKDTKPEYAWGEGTPFTGPKFGMHFMCKPPPCVGVSSFNYGGQTYNTVEIGGQCWMAENLNIGDMINSSLDQTNNSIVEKYCYNNDPNNCDIYGGLYQWDELMQYVTTEGAHGICPTGWHIPTDDEWKQLEGEVDSQYGYPDPEWDPRDSRGYDVGKRLKSENGWINNGNGIDSHGFSALPSGYRYPNGLFYAQESYTLFWSSSEYNTDNAWNRDLGYDTDEVVRWNNDRSNGFSVRCLKE